MFRVLTYNIFKFDGPVGPEKVIEAIVAQGADLICFQEVFNTAFPGLGRNARKILEDALPSEGFTPIWFKTSGPPLIGAFHDGLLFAVRAAKFDFQGVADEDYFTTYLSSGLSRRGIQCALVREIQGNRVLAICNTHLTVGSKPKKRERRLREVESAIEFIRGIEQQHAPAGTILVGDFNALDFWDEIKMLKLATAGEEPLFQDTFKHRNPAAPGFTMDRENNTIAAEREPMGDFEGSARIDYVFLRPPHGAGGPDIVNPVSSQVVLNAPDPELGESLSDHFGVLTEFDLA